RRILRRVSKDGSPRSSKRPSFETRAKRAPQDEAVSVSRTCFSRGDEHMNRTLIAAGAMMISASVPAMAQQKSVKIGFVSTFSGPTGVIGNDMRNFFELALDHLGRRMGALPVEVVYEDDQQKPEVGKQKTEKLIESDHVDFIVGFIWSNVLLASL